MDILWGYGLIKYGFLIDMLWWHGLAKLTLERPFPQNKYMTAPFCGSKTSPQ